MSGDPFVLVEAGRDRMLLRAELRDELSRLLPAFLDGEALIGTRVLAGGRGETISVPLRDGTRAVLRRNLRGGLPARVVRDLYLGPPSRPFAEVRATQRLLQAGVAVPEPLGGVARDAGPALYRGAVATREIAGSSNLWEYLCAASSPVERRAACDLAIALVDRLLASDAIHPDLNLKNFLVSADGRHAWLIDCDGVRFSPTGPEHRRRAMARLRRSALRLDPLGGVVEASWFETGRAARGAQA